MPSNESAGGYSSVYHTCHYSTFTDATLKEIVTRSFYLKILVID